MKGGRPLWFLAIVLGGWTVARGLDIYRRSGEVVDAWHHPVAQLAAAIGVPTAAAAPAHWQQVPKPKLPTAEMRVVPYRAARRRPPAVEKREPATIAEQRHDAADGAVAVAPLMSPAAMPQSIARTGARLTGSAWLIVRNGSAVDAPGGQLGASQMGARITYALGRSRRFALAARVSAPVSGRGKEAAIGIDWQPTKAPVHIIAEHRLSLDGGRGGPMLGVVGGFGPVEIAPDVRVEGYGQAGVIARDGGEAFADGAVRAARSVARVGAVHFDIGAGAWGGAQRGAARLDIGPSIGIVLPLGRQAIRLTADWRQRIAGDARPGSGPALSVGTNF